MNDDMPMMGEVLTRDSSGFSMPGSGQGQGDVVPYGGSALIQQTSRTVTAQKVAVARQLPTIMREIREYCAEFGDTYIYSWDVKNKGKGTSSTIEGGTIKLAMMLTQTFGNCGVDMDITETATHWIFKSWFTDYEKGTQISRLFQQRKNQSTGMSDIDRQADIVFQIGQSKAMRNVVLNALSSFTTYALEESKRGLLKRFDSAEAREKAWAFIHATMERHNLVLKQLEAIIGRPNRDWTVPNLAKAYMLMRGVAEGLVSPADAFPTDETADEINTEAATERKSVQKREGRATKAKQEEAKPQPAATENEQGTQKASDPETTGQSVGNSDEQISDDAGDDAGAVEMIIEQIIQALTFVDLDAVAERCAPVIEEMSPDSAAQVEKLIADRRAVIAKESDAKAPKQAATATQLFGDE